MREKVRDRGRLEHIQNGINEILADKDIVIMVGIVVFFCLLCLLMPYVFPAYSARIVTDNHISNAITIVSTFIIGECVILLVENQHIKGEVTCRYYSLLRPFFHQLTAYCKFAQQCMFALRASDEFGRTAKEQLEHILEPIKRVALNSILTGKNSSWLRFDFLVDLCNRINKVWFVFDRN